MMSGTRTDLTIRRAGPTDAALLAALGATSFADTFAADNRPEDMATYLAEAFGESIQRAELADPACVAFVAERDGEAVGYAMLHDGPAPATVGDAPAIEIARLYASRRWIGAGVGAALMQRCLDEAGARGCGTVWLGVWERNARAIGFYERWGFGKVGSQTFQLGSDLQTDHVMARRTGREG
jgi:GNAT superfamily N-acetyltransferase